VKKINFRISRGLAVSILAILFGLLAGVLLILLTGGNPFASYLYLIQGGVKNLERIGNTLATSTPLILTGLSVAFAFRTGLFNIGAAGQMLMGGLCATAIGLKVNLPGPLLVFLMFLGAMVGGAIWGSIPGLIKAKFNVHEVVSSIMMNWISYWLVYYAVPAYLKGPFLETESARLADSATLKSAWLSNLMSGSYINYGLFLALGAAALTAFILNRTVMGYELKSVGFNRYAAEYAGIRVNRNIISAMMIAGALAGLAGLTHYAGNSANMQIGVMPSQGFDGIAVSLLAMNSPWGVVASAIFFGLLYSGKGFMNAMTSTAPEIADTIIATIIYFAATSVMINRLLDRFQNKNKR
jgi:ABC-type uncharacterized transport system permease subunit